MRSLAVGLVFLLQVTMACAAEAAAVGAGPAEAKAPVAAPPATEEDGRRAKLLLADADHFTIDNLRGFTLHFRYYPPKGGKPGDGPSLILRTWNVKDDGVPYLDKIVLKKEQAVKIIEQMAATGRLGRMQCTNSPTRYMERRPDPTGPVYVLSMATAGWEFEEPLAWSAQAYWRLLELREFLEGEGADTLARHMLTPLGAQHVAWKGAGETALAMLKDPKMDLILSYQETADKVPALNLRAFSGKAPDGRPGGKDVWLQVRPVETRALIDALAACGVLETLTPMARGPRPEPGYRLQIDSPGVLCKQLGWNVGVRTLLETMAAGMPPGSHAAEAFDEVLERLEPMRAEWDKAAGLKPAPLDWQKPGDYTYGPWKYVYRFDQGRESEVIGHWGYLYYRGKGVDGINLSDTLQTPWGKLFWTGIREMPNGPHGWMREADKDQPVGRALPGPLDAIRYHEVEGQDARRMLVHGRPEKLEAEFPGPNAAVADGGERLLAAAISVQQGKAVLAQAAYAGLLGKAVPGWIGLPVNDLYTLTFSWPTGKSGQASYGISLGSRSRAAEQLGAVKAVLDGKAAEVMGQVVGRLAELP
jgi:hypothetical protein